jgi:hypothetical protein
MARAFELRKKGDRAAALAIVEPLLAASPAPASALNLDGLLRLDRLDVSGAKSSFRRALESMPSMPQAHFNLALALLLEGNYEEGWSEYEWRTKSPGYADYANHPFGMPRWRGEPLSGRSILVHAEQGHGDTIQFARFLPRIASEGAAIDVFCQPPLVPLIARVEGVRTATSDLVERPTNDYHATIFDLGAYRLPTVNSEHWFGTYVAASPERLHAWADRIAVLPRPRIGIAWKGSPLHNNDRNRSLPAEYVARLIAGSASFVSLQMGTEMPVGTSGTLVDAGSHIKDWDDTAAIVSYLDLVITVDTAVAHLSGAMGKPVWNLLAFAPDWRWGIGSETTRWYPSMKLFRQESPEDWAPVIERVHVALQDFIRARS